jgi:hypothetical protein
MSREQFQEDCPGCRPVGTDLDGQPLPADHAINVALNQLWANTDIVTKTAFHRCTCLSSRNPTDLALCQDFIKRLETRLTN